MNILITAATTSQAYQVERALKKEVNIIFADSAELPKIAIGDKQFIKIASGDDPSFAHLLLTTCLDWNIAEVYPLRKTEVIALAEAKLLFDEYGIKVLVPDKERIEALIATECVGKQVLIADGNEPSISPDRGIFKVDDFSKTLKLFTVD